MFITSELNNKHSDKPINRQKKGHIKSGSRLLNRQKIDYLIQHII